MALLSLILFCVIYPIVFGIIALHPNKDLRPVMSSTLISVVLALACASGIYAANGRPANKTNLPDTTSISNSYSRLLEEASQEPKEIQEYRKKLEIESKAELEKKKAEIRAEFQAKQQKELDELKSDLEKKKVEIILKYDTDLYKELTDFKNEIEKKKESLKLKIMSEWNKDFDEFKARQNELQHHS